MFMMIPIQHQHGDDDEGSDRPNKRKRSHPMKTRSNKTTIDNPAEIGYTYDEYDYYARLPVPERRKIAELENNITFEHSEPVPIRFRFLMADMPPAIKSLAISKCSELARMYPGAGEFAKLSCWLQMMSIIPFGMPEQVAESPQTLLNRVKSSLDDAVNGHENVKQEILHFVAQRILNPKSKGRVLCLAGAPGIAKTHIARYGISQALNRPFATIAIGGANDGSFLVGHQYCFDGSRPGIIVQELMRAGRKDCVFLFDEVDKISLQRGGYDITNILMQLTDATQNECFRDQYFLECPIDMSHAFIVMSCNDPDLIDPILRDRLTIVQMKGYTKQQKVDIFKSHLLRDICSDFGFAINQIQIEDAVILHIIESIHDEQGVRGLKKSFAAILSGLITQKMLQDDFETGLVYVIDHEVVNRRLDDTYRKAHPVHCMMYV